MDKKVAESIEQFRANPKNVNFDEIVKLCTKLWGQPRQSGSHLVFKTGLAPPDHQINVQRAGKEAKPYQVRQLLRVISLLSLDVP